MGNIDLRSVTKSAIRVVAISYAIVTASCAVNQRSLLYHPDDTIPDPAAYGVAGMEVVRIPVEEGIGLLGWWRAPADADRPVIVLFHGNAGHLGYRAGKARLFMDAGYGVLLVSWRYNAQAGGDPGEAELIADGRAALAFLAGREVSAGRIVVYGESLGSGVAVALAAENDLAGLVLESPFSSVAEVAQHHFWYLPARWLILDEFDSVSRIAGVDEPLLLVHGASDTLIPPEFARRLYDAAPGQKEAHFVAGAGHNDLYAHGAGRFVVDFIERRVVAAGATKPGEAS